MHNDAMNIALMFSSSKSTETKGGADKSIKSIIPVEEDGETLLYGVNFEDGFLLISGTKNFYPILAEVAHGYFDGTPMGTGADVLLSEIKNQIKAVNTNPELRVGDGYYVDGNVASIQAGEVLNPSSSRYDLLISW